MLRHFSLIHPVVCSAQDRRAAREACHADYQRHCPGVMPGQGRIVACLRSHIDQLSPECRAVMEQHIASSK